MRRPSYIKLAESGELEDRSKRAIAALEECKLCPRDCGVDRLNGKTGFCGIDRHAVLASHNIHAGEEPPISGTRGSGTIFFSGCNMKCMFCQNYPISWMHNGSEAQANSLAGMMLNLQSRGAHNINLVTPSHVVPQIIEAVDIASRKGLSIPLVYNSSGYDSVDTLKLLDGVVDIYMPDLKYASEENSKYLSSAPNYWTIAKSALLEMKRQVGGLLLLEKGVAIRGMLIRHLVLPEDLASSKLAFEFIADKIGRDVPVSLMSQYFPAHIAVSDKRLGRKITADEFKTAKKWLVEFGLTEGWIQEMD